MDRALENLERPLRARAWDLFEDRQSSGMEHPKTAGTAQSPPGECSMRKRGHMEGSLADLEQILRARICRVCSYRREDGSCGLEKPADCPLFQYLPQVVRAIQKTDSTDVSAYLGGIRSEVCSICPQQAADGSCELRDRVRCALDAYLLLIVDAIEEAVGKQQSRLAACYSR
jgi:hypothetical protein